RRRASGRPQAPCPIPPPARKSTQLVADCVAEGSASSRRVVGHRVRDRRVTRSTGARLARRGRTAGLAAALVAGLLLTGCDNPSRLAGIAAQVADTGTHGPADRAYGRQFAALIAQDGHDRLVKANGLGPDR